MNKVEEILREALKFYADAENYFTRAAPNNTFERLVINDSGKLAREALVAVPSVAPALKSLDGIPKDGRMFVVKLKTSHNSYFVVWSQAHKKFRFCGGATYRHQEFDESHIEWWCDLGVKQYLGAPSDDE